MDRQQLMRQVTAEQFAAFDTQLYLDTHPNDKVALNMFNNYIKSHEEYKKQYESRFGPLMAESGAAGDVWVWGNEPWPWEKEAN
jgi:spore coat protein JB